MNVNVKVSGDGECISETGLSGLCGPRYGPPRATKGCLGVKRGVWGHKGVFGGVMGSVPEVLF